jgi:hypothetical protein
MQTITYAHDRPHFQCTTYTNLIVNVMYEYKYYRMSRYILNEVETSHDLILIRLYFILTILITEDDHNHIVFNKLLLSESAVSCLLCVRSVSFTSRAKGCIKFVPHSCLVSLSHKVGVFLGDTYFTYTINNIVVNLFSS